ncbi:hypothetical protein DFH28DRAFT_1135001 [Melampsora americana]|nr:hypothetical protein DFH28DRAFT_1135001 [Melampsora americana]
MSVFDEFLDSMYGKEVPRKRTLSHVNNSVTIPNSVQPPAASPKRAKVTPSKPLPYILTEREMSLADFQKELNADKERLKRSINQSILDKSKSLEQLQASEQSTSGPTSASTAMSESRRIPHSLPSSATPSPMVTRNTTSYNRPSESSPIPPASTSPSSAIPTHSSYMVEKPLADVPLLRTRSASDFEPEGSPQASQSHSI